MISAPPIDRCLRPPARPSPLWSPTRSRDACRCLPFNRRRRLCVLWAACSYHSRLPGDGRRRASSDELSDQTPTRRRPMQRSKGRPRRLALPLASLAKGSSVANTVTSPAARKHRDVETLAPLLRQGDDADAARRKKRNSPASAPCSRPTACQRAHVGLAHVGLAPSSGARC